MSTSSCDLCIKTIIETKQLLKIPESFFFCKNNIVKDKLDLYLSRKFVFSFLMAHLYSSKDLFLLSAIMA